jgi:Ni/Co efflux regulator RcnB
MNRIVLLITAGAWLAAGSASAENRVNQRMQDQQKRIGQGIADGQLTPREGAKLEHQEANLRREVHQDRKANGGKLTPDERAQVNRQQNHLSREIYRDKHNARRVR